MTTRRQLWVWYCQLLGLLAFGLAGTSAGMICYLTNTNRIGDLLTVALAIGAGGLLAALAGVFYGLWVSQSYGQVRPTILRKLALWTFRWGFWGATLGPIVVCGTTALSAALHGRLERLPATIDLLGICLFLAGFGVYAGWLFGAVGGAFFSLLDSPIRRVTGRWYYLGFPPDPTTAPVLAAAGTTAPPPLAPSLAKSLWRRWLWT